MFMRVSSCVERGRNIFSSVGGNILSSTVETYCQAWANNMAKPGWKYQQVWSENSVKHGRRYCQAWVNILSSVGGIYLQALAIHVFKRDQRMSSVGETCFLLLVLLLLVYYYYYYYYPKADADGGDD